MILALKKPMQALASSIWSVESVRGGYLGLLALMITKTGANVKIRVMRSTSTCLIHKSPKRFSGFLHNVIYFVELG